MSKPITHEEVEDVLSSIRRLVSEDKRPMAGLRGTGAQNSSNGPATEASDRDRFVLTPALRVARSDEDEEVEPPLNLGDVAVTSSETEEGGDSDLAPSTLTAPEEIAAAIDDETVIDSLLQEAFAKEIRKGDDLTSLVDAATTGARGEDESVAQDMDDDGPEAAFVEVRESWELETGADEDISEFRPDRAAQADADLDEAETEDGLNDAPDAETSGATEPETEAQDEPEREPLVLMPEDARPTGISAKAMVSLGASKGAEDTAGSEAAADTDADRDQSLTSKIAALETAIGAMRQGFEPDGDEDETLTPRLAPALAWKDDVELDARGTPMAGPSPDEPADDTQEARQGRPAMREASGDRGAGLELEDQLMDEEALRDLVSEIVRAELQGALGERITRNVRKLVRREIHRALTAQEME